MPKKLSEMNDKERTEYWIKYGKKHLLGRKVIDVRYLEEEEMEVMGWSTSSLVITFDDGTMVFPSMDDEGNGAGAIFGQTEKGEDLTFPVL